MKKYLTQLKNRCMEIVSGIPNYLMMHHQLLPLAQKLASQPLEYLKTLEQPQSFYSKGWSCGVEQGNFINQKDPSIIILFMMNSNLGVRSQDLLKKGNHIRTPNVWPNTNISELEGAFKNLGGLMVDVRALLACHIEKYIYSKCSTYEMGILYQFIRTGNYHVGRLFYYFDGTITEVWCGWHNDHSALTALTCPIYMNKDKMMDYQDKESGLFAKNRFAQIFKTGMNPECLAFQIGETAQIVSRVIVEETPHCIIRLLSQVVKSDETARLGLSRNRFAVFMGPVFNEFQNIKKCIDKSDALNKIAYNILLLFGRWDKI